MKIVIAPLYRPCAVAEAFAEASDNVRLTSRNIAAAVKLGVGLRPAGNPPLDA